MKKMNLFITILTIFAWLNLCFAEVSCAQSIEIPKNSKTYAVCDSELSSITSNKGDFFKAKIVEDLNLTDKIIIPKESIVTGEVSKVIKAKRLSRNAEIDLSVCEILTPQGKRYILSNKKVHGKIISPYAKSYKERTAERIPVVASSLGTSIPLGTASTLNDGVVYAISQGVTIVVGFIEGLIDPDYGYTRLQSGFRRSFEVTPLGTINTVIRKGKDATLFKGQTISLTFDRETLEKLVNQYQENPLVK